MEVPLSDVQIAVDIRVDVFGSAAVASDDLSVVAYPVVSLTDPDLPPG